MTKQDVEVGILIDGDWVAPDVHERDAITIKTGTANWGGRPDSGQLSASLINNDGAWSADNATSAHHPHLLARNLPIRVGLAGPDVHLEWIGGSTFEVATADDHASLDITGDIDLRIELRLDVDPFDLTTGIGERIRLAHKLSGADGWEWELWTVDDAVGMRFAWWDSSVAFHAYETLDASVAYPRSVLHERVALRLALDVNNGAGDSACHFYYSDSIGGSWTLIGTATGTGVGVTDLATNNAPVRVGANPADASHTPIQGRIYAFELLDGIDGTAVLQADFTAQTAGASSFSDQAGRDWNIIAAGGRLTTNVWRFQGEVAAWPLRWTTGGHDVWAPIEAAGILRRLRQRAARLQSPLRRALTSATTLGQTTINYWPMEESGDDVAIFGAAIGVRVLTLVAGEISAAQSDDFVCSAPIPTLGTGILTAPVNGDLQDGTEWQVRCLLSVPSGYTTDVAELLRIETFGLTWQLRYDGSSGGDLQLTASAGTTQIYDSTLTDYNLNGRPCRLSISAVQDGADLDVTMIAVDVGDTLGGGIADTISNQLVSKVIGLALNPSATAGDIAIGHVTVQHTATSGDLADELAGHLGETAAARFKRLCTEELLPSQLIGEVADSIAMGPQPIATLTSLLEECAATDLGLLGESTLTRALTYRTGASLRNQAELALDHGAGELGAAPHLDRDDQRLANDVSVTNWTQTTARAELTTGRLSTAEPPVGIGRYTADYPISIYNEQTLADHASQRLHIATPATPRVSQLQLRLDLPAIGDTLTAAILAITIGDTITLENLVGTSQDLAQLVLGWRERIGTHEHRLEAVTLPAGPWLTGVVEGTVPARYDTAGSQLAAGASQGATSLSVATTLGPLWTTDGADLPLDVLADDVRVTVTAIAGATSPQTFTVTGVVRDLAAGAEVRLADPSTYTL